MGEKYKEGNLRLKLLSGTTRNVLNEECEERGDRKEAITVCWVNPQRQLSTGRLCAL